MSMIQIHLATHLVEILCDVKCDGELILKDIELILCAFKETTKP